MSETIDLGLGYEDLKDLAKFKPIPLGKYRFRIAKFEKTKTDEGRPMIAWHPQLFGEEAARAKVAKRMLYYNTPLPWKGNTDGLGFLAALFVGVGYKYDGKEFNPSDLLGKEGILEVTGYTVSKKDPTKKFENIRIIT